MGRFFQCPPLPAIRWSSPQNHWVERAALQSATGPKTMERFHCVSQLHSPAF